jgi:hypothetical protein
MANHEFVTTFVVKHEAGSEEGAIFQRNEYDKAIKELGGEVVMADTKPGDARGEGLRLFTEPEERDG